MDRLKKILAYQWTVNYIQKMPRGTQIKVADVPVNDKKLLIEMVKEYIDFYHDAEFNENYTKIRKLSKWE
jgi:hypothetical protein